MKRSMIFVGVIVAGCAMPVQKGALDYREGFRIVPESDSQLVTPGETTHLRLDIQRSSTFSEAPIWLDVISPLPQGMKVTFEPNPAKEDFAVAHFTLSAGAKPSKDLMILSYNSNTPGWPKKGITLKIVSKEANRTENVATR